MNCPHCESCLNPVRSRKHVQVNLCASACGIWLDGQEILKLAENPGDFQKCLEKGFLRSPVGGFLCPHCGDARTVRKTLVESGPVMDICPKCYGMWFDRSELGEIEAAFGEKTNSYACNPAFPPSPNARLRTVAKMAKTS